MVALFALAVPFILFIGGAYILHFPWTLGLFYAFNLAIMYVIIWSLANQCIKIFSQTMVLQEHSLVLARKQIFLSFPMVRSLELQIPVESIEEITLQQSRISYQMTARFRQDGKTLGVDLDLNPLKVENKTVLQQLLQLNTGIKIDKPSRGILDKYNNEVMSWRASYTLSFFVIALALIVFPIVSIMLGSKL